MAGLNTTGKTDTRHYNLGRGRVYAALLDANDAPGHYEFLGNAPEFAIQVESEDFEHYSSQEGLKFLDLLIETQKSVGLSLTLDEMNQQNLARFFSGDTATYTNPAIAGFAQHEIIAEGSIVLGSYFPITDSNGNQAYDVDNDDLTLETTNATPVPLVRDVDYELDAEMGMIYLIPTSTVLATAISGSEGLDITLAANGSASVVTEVQGATGSSKKLSIMFLGINPVDNDKPFQVIFHKSRLKAEGDLSLIGDEVTTMPFTGAAERNEAAPGSSKVLTHRNVTSPTAT